MTANPSPPKAPKDPAVAKAIASGKALIAQGKSKVAATRAMYPLIQSESREVICQAFLEGADLTERGALTYFYNAVRYFKQHTPSA